MRNVLAAVVVLVACNFRCGATAAEYLGENASFVGADLVGRPLVLESDLVLEFDGLRGLVRDWSDPRSPAWVGGFTSPFGFIERAVYGSGLVVGLYSDLTPGAALVDMTDPRSPSILFSGFPPYHFTSAIVGEGMVYLASTDWMLGYDISTPTAPRLVSVNVLAPTDRLRWPSRSGDLLYLLDGPAALRVLDLGRPAEPVELGTVSLPTSRVDAMVTTAGHLYTVQAGAAGLDLAVYDLSVPLAPVLVFHAALAQDGVQGTDLVVRDDILYAATSAHRVHAFSLTTPALPVAGFTLASGPHALAVTRSAVLLLDDDEMDVFARTAYDEQPSLLAKRQALPELAELATNGQVTVAAGRSTGDLLVIDVIDPRSPAVTAIWPGVNAQKVAISGTLAAASSPSAVQLIDVTDPLAADQLARVEYPQADASVRSCALGGGLLAVTLPSFGTLLYDVADPREPRLRFTMRQVHGKVLIAGDRLLTINSANRAAVYDVSDPDLPQLMGTLPLAGVRDIAFSQGHASLLTSGGLYLYQINGYGDFTRLSRTPVFDDARLAAAGDRVYAIGTRAVHIVNVADPVQPTIDGWFEGTGVVFLVSADHGLIHLDIGRNSYLVRDETWQATAVPDDAPRAGARLLAAPNPFNPAVTIAFSLARPAEASLTVHDTRGRLIARLAAGALAAGPHAVTWRGLDDAGRPAASGVYLVRLTTGDDAPATTRVTLMR